LRAKTQGAQLAFTALDDDAFTFVNSANRLPTLYPVVSTPVVAYPSNQAGTPFNYRQSSDDWTVDYYARVN